jgi:hypothetical protein
MRNLYSRATCSALLVTCSDFRFKSTERGVAESLALIDDYDLIARPGAARSLVVPRTPAARDTMGEEIRLLWSLHQFPRVVLLNHVSCRAYDDLATTDNEVEVHSQHLLRAVPIVEAMCTGLQAEPWLIEFDGDEFRSRRVDQ